MGEPVRLMVDMPQETAIVDLLVHDPARRLLLASSAGDGFLVPETEMLASKRAGKQVLTLRDATALRPVPVPPEGDHVAVIGENRKMLVFPLSELPEMPRGKGVRLQRFKDGGLSDVTVLRLADGLRWVTEKGQNRHQQDLGEWIGARAQSGRMAPRGFPRDNRFPAPPDG
jgi:topoisomerase-4 subunit A